MALFPVYQAASTTTKALLALAGIMFARQFEPPWAHSYKVPPNCERWFIFFKLLEIHDDYDDELLLLLLVLLLLLLLL